MLLVSFAVFGQGYSAHLMVGANFSQVDGDQFAGYNKLGFNTGIAINREFKGKWSGGFELLYTQKGSQKVLDPDVPEPSLVINYHYVEVPIIARYQVMEKVSAYAGPSIGVVVFNERDDNGFVSKEEGLNSWELAMHLGVSYAFTNRWNADLRHSYSLWSVRDYPMLANSIMWFGRSGWYNRLFTLGLRYDLGQ